MGIFWNYTLNSRAWVCCLPTKCHYLKLLAWQDNLLLLNDWMALFLSPVFLSVKHVYMSARFKFALIGRSNIKLHEQRLPSNTLGKLMKYKEGPLMDHQNKSNSCVLVSCYLIFSGVCSSSFGSVFCPCLASKTLICTCSSMQTSLSL